MNRSISSLSSHPTHQPEEIREDLFRLRIPLPQTPLKYLNAYVIRSRDRHLVVDVGLNLDACREAMTAGLEMLGVALEKTDFFITHMHVDHLGLLPELADLSSTVYFNGPEAHLLRHWKGPADLLNYMALHGFPSSGMRKVFAAHPAGRLRYDRFPVPVQVKDGDIITAGPYRWRCVHTPGHTPGHMCLYDPERKLLIAGDHLLADISPNLVCWSDAENPLKHFLESLGKVAGLEVETVLPGHRRVFRGHRRRIAELKDHHARRLEQALEILARQQMSAFEVAARMTWEFANGRWENFPVTQQWFATGEALAHLRYLEDAGVIERVMTGNIVKFLRKRHEDAKHIDHTHIGVGPADLYCVGRHRRAPK